MRVIYACGMMRIFYGKLFIEVKVVCEMAIESPGLGHNCAKLVYIRGPKTHRS